MIRAARALARTMTNSASTSIAPRRERAVVPVPLACIRSVLFIIHLAGAARH
jgi:hypothetical protein